MANTPEKNYVNHRLDHIGMIAGFIASKTINKRGEGAVLAIVLGIVGAIVGGWLFIFFGAQGVTDLNIYSMFVAALGSIVMLVLYHMVTGQRA
jgi:uncharacterized membrane protein YeaQ/YmgE (transglycosylase-associated protein family)